MNLLQLVCGAEESKAFVLCVLCFPTGKLQAGKLGAEVK